MMSPERNCVMVFSYVFSMWLSGYLPKFIGKVQFANTQFRYKQMAQLTTSVQTRCSCRGHSHKKYGGYVVLIFTQATARSRSASSSSYGCGPTRCHSSGFMLRNIWILERFFGQRPGSGESHQNLPKFEPFHTPKSVPCAPLSGRRFWRSGGVFFENLTEQMTCFRFFMGKLCKCYFFLNNFPTFGYFLPPRPRLARFHSTALFVLVGFEAVILCLCRCYRASLKRKRYRVSIHGSWEIKWWKKWLICLLFLSHGEFGAVCSITQIMACSRHPGSSPVFGPPWAFLSQTPSADGIGTSRMSRMMRCHFDGLESCLGASQKQRHEKKHASLP